MEYEKKVDCIVEVLRKGEKEDRNFKVGVEFEHIVVKKNNFESVSYFGREGIEEILRELLHKRYEGEYEQDYLIGLKKEDNYVSIEPGAQLEFSARPCKDIKEIEQLYLSFVNDVVPILESKGAMMLGIGFLPKTSIQQIKFIPKKRYEYMSNYFKTKGKYAHYMMKGTASLQVSIDYFDEKDFVKKFKVANLLSPLFSIITDNAPIFEGELYRKNSVRTMIWNDMDDSRCGNVLGVMSKVYGYREYAEYILNVEPILIVKDGRIKNTENETVASIMDTCVFNQNEIEHLMSMVFPDVRAKQYIEIRTGDSLPYPLNLSYVALIKGLFYNEKSLDYLLLLAQEIGEGDLLRWKENILEKGFDANILGCTTKELISVIFDLSKKGLSHEEKEYLKPLETLMLKQKTATMISKELIETKGLEALRWCALRGKG